MLKFLNVFAKVIDAVGSNGKKRIKLSITHAIYMAVAVLCVWAIYALSQSLIELSNTTGGCTSGDFGNALLMILGIIACAIVGSYTLFAGVIAQSVLLVCALIGSFISSQRSRNLIAFIIALISLSAVLIGALFIFGVF